MRNWWRAIKKQLDAPWAAYTFAICVGVVLFLVLSHISFVWDAFKAFYHYISPVVIGIVIAYVLDPMVKFWENRVFYKMKQVGGGHFVNVFMEHNATEGHLRHGDCRFEQIEIPDARCSAEMHQLVEVNFQNIRQREKYRLICHLASSSKDLR